MFAERSWRGTEREAMRGGGIIKCVFRGEGVILLIGVCLYRQTGRQAEKLGTKRIEFNPNEEISELMKSLELEEAENWAYRKQGWEVEMEIW